MPTTSTQEAAWQQLEKRLEQLKRQQRLLVSQAEDLQDRVHHLRKVYKKSS